MKQRLLIAALALGVLNWSPVHAVKPAFDCDKATGKVEEMICADSALAQLDIKMDGVWKQVRGLAQKNVDFDLIQAEQRGWIKGRNDCWKSDDVRSCVETSYRLRIAELQSRWRLVPAQGPLFFVCDDNAADEVVATFFATDPPAAILERGDQTVVAFRAASADTARYEGQNVRFCTRADEAVVTWGWEASERRYRLRQRSN